MATLELPIEAQFATGGVALLISVPNGGGIAVHGESGGVNADGDIGVGLRGSGVDKGFGVVGTSSGGIAVLGEGEIGVEGHGSTGVRGKSGGGTGVIGESDSGVGVSGATRSSAQNAIFGFNGGGGQVPDGLDHPAGAGVWGHTTVNRGTGVLGTVQPGLTDAAGLTGVGPVAGKFFGNVVVAGNISVDGDVLLANKDLAERFPRADDAACEPGMIMVIDGEGRLEPCSEAYDRRVIGVVSGAVGNRAAITLGAGDDPRATVSIALVGTVSCRVDADLAPVASGDLVTTSPTPGYGMKACDPQRSFGAVIGKALASLPTGRGFIPLLISSR